ncbi:MAG: HAMP domain-containing histidine kinase [Magnetovibrio sp.]|nr:HAMP domain-containing histidine kinase [Magnetovibrio sp.]
MSEEDELGSTVTLIKSQNNPVTTVSKLAHEIKNHLNVIIGFTHLMRDENRKDISLEQMRAWSQTVHDATISLTKTCERVLDDECSSFSTVKKEDIDFHQFGASLVQFFQQEAKAQGLSLTLSLGNQFPILHTDPVLLTEILNNLLHNAIKFTPRGGTINIKGEVDVQSKALILMVQDSGQGISSDILLALRRGESVTTSSDKKKYKGWGVGLRVITDNAQKLNCQFELHCPKDKGTIACLKFPLS